MLIRVLDACVDEPNVKVKSAQGGDLGLKMKEIQGNGKEFLTRGHIQDAFIRLA